MANKYIRPTPFMAACKALLMIVSALAAFTLLWILSLKYAVIASWIGHHLFVVVCCLPVLLAMALFHFGMSMAKNVLLSNHSTFARGLVSKTAIRLSKSKDSLSQAGVLNQDEISQLKDILYRRNTIDAVTRVLLQDRHGLLLLRKAIPPKENHATNKATTSSKYLVEVQSLLPRKILLAFVDKSGKMIGPQSISSDTGLAIYIYPKSKISGGNKLHATFPHTYKTKKGIDRRCEPVLCIHPNAPGFTEMVVISDTHQTSAEILSIEANLGMSLHDLFSVRSLPRYSLPSPHSLRTTWADGQFTLEQALQVITDVTRIISQHHANTGKSHLDLTCKNITIDRQGRVFVIDYPDYLASSIYHTPGESVLSAENTLFWQVAKYLDPQLTELLNKHSQDDRLGIPPLQYGLHGNPDFSRLKVHTRSFMGDSLLKPSDYQSLYHDTWATLTIALRCVNMIDNTVKKAYAQHAVIMTAVDILKDVQSQLRSCQFVPNIGWGAPISPAESLTRSLNTEWPVQKMLDKIRHYLGVNAQDFFTVDMPVSDMPVSDMPERRSIFEHMGKRVAQSHADRLLKINKIFKKYAASLAHFHRKYQQSHLAISCHTLMLPTQYDTHHPFIDWDILIDQRERNEICYPIRLSNITSKHEFFQALNEQDPKIVVSINSTNEWRTPLFPFQFEYLRELTPHDDNLGPSRYMHDIWSLLHAYHTSILAFEYDPSSPDQQHLLLCNTAFSEITQSMTGILKARRDGQVFPDDCAEVFTGLTQRIHAQFTCIQDCSMEENGFNQSLQQVQQLRYETLGSGCSTNPTIDQFLEKFSTLIESLRGMYRQTKSASLLALAPIFIDVDRHYNLRMNWSKWLLHRATPNLTTIVREDIITGLRMCLELVNSKPHAVSHQLFDHSDKQNSNKMLHMNIDGKIVSREISMNNQFQPLTRSLNNNDTLNSLTDTLSDTSMVYADTWLMLHALLRSFALLKDEVDGHTDTVNQTFIQPILMEMLDLIHAIKSAPGADARQKGQWIWIQSDQDKWSVTSVLSRLQQQIAKVHAAQSDDHTPIHAPKNPLNFFSGDHQASHGSSPNSSLMAADDDPSTSRINDIVGSTENTGNLIHHFFSGDHQASHGSSPNSSLMAADDDPSTSRINDIAGLTGNTGNLIHPE